MSRALLLAAIIASLFLGALPSSGAAQQGPAPAFEVSSVKASPPDTWQGGIRRMEPGTISLAAMTLREALALCFYLHPYQIIGGPDWAAKRRFDIVGKDPSMTVTTTGKLDRPAWAAAMDADDVKLRGLLKDRFALQYHNETRPMPGFVLLTQKGSKFDSKPCSTKYRLQHGWVDGEIRMTSLAALLKAELGAPVKDMTGLIGCYHLEAKWTTDPSETSVPQLPTALHDFGLQIQKAKINVDVLVIDHAELPKPD